MIASSTSNAYSFAEIDFLFFAFAFWQESRYFCFLVLIQRWWNYHTQKRLFWGGYTLQQSLHGPCHMSAITSLGPHLPLIPLTPLAVSAADSLHLILHHFTVRQLCARCQHQPHCMTTTPMPALLPLRFDRHLPPTLQNWCPALLHHSNSYSVHPQHQTNTNFPHITNSLPPLSIAPSWLSSIFQFSPTVNFFPRLFRTFSRSGSAPNWRIADEWSVQSF